MNNKFLCVWTGYVSQYFVIFNFYILLYTQGNLIKNLAIFCAIITIQLFNINTQQCGSLNNFTDIGIGHCVESCCDNVKEEFDGASLTVREEEDWVVSAGNREEGAKIWTEH